MANTVVASSIWHGRLSAVDFENRELTFSLQSMGPPIGSGSYAIMPIDAFHSLVERAGRMDSLKSSIKPQAPQEAPDA